MFKRTIVALTVLVAMLCFAVKVDAAKPTQWLIYWYVCGTDIETTRIAFGSNTNLMSDDPKALQLAEPDREPGDATRCIKEIERAELSPDVRIFMQAGGTYVWGHEKFRDLNAKINTAIGYVKDENGEETPITVYKAPSVSVRQWFLTGGGGHTVATPKVNGKLGRYVYDKDHRSWYPREQLPIITQTVTLEDGTLVDVSAPNTETDMGSKAGFVSFLRAGQKLERELYPDGNVRRALILVDHGGGIRGVCADEYTGNMLGLKEISDAFAEVNGGWTNPDEKPFEVVAFDACIMSVYETAVAVEDAAKYMVASQESTIGKVMFGYTGLLNDLSKNPSMSGSELGKVICNTTWEDSKITDKEFGINSNSVFTESVIDLSAPKMDALKTAYANFSEAAVRVVQKNPDDIVQTFVKFKNAANVAERFSILAGDPDMVDLKNFADNVKETFPELNATGTELVKAIDNSVVYNKRGSAYKRGGGLSIYYPFDLIYSGAKTYKAVTANDNLSPAAPEKLYDYLYSGVTENLKLESVVDPKTKKTINFWTIPKGSVFDLSGLSGVDVDVDEDKKTASIELDEDQLKGVESVRYRLLYIVPRKDDDEKMDALYLGSDSDIDENRQTGTFKVAFNGKKWVTLDGEPLLVQVISDATRKNNDGKKIGGNDICYSPVLLNGERYKLFFVRNYPNEKVSLIGVAPDNDGQITLPSGQLESFKKGDIVTPLYVQIKDGNVELARGKSITIGDKPNLETATLYNGIFVYAFEFVNPLGEGNIYKVENGKLVKGNNNVITSEGAVVKCKDGNVVKVMPSSDFENIGDLDD